MLPRNMLLIKRFGLLSGEYTERREKVCGKRKCTTQNNESLEDCCSIFKMFPTIFPREGKSWKSHNSFMFLSYNLYGKAPFCQPSPFNSHIKSCFIEKIPGGSVIFTTKMDFSGKTVWAETWKDQQCHGSQITSCIIVRYEIFLSCFSRVLPNVSLFFSPTFLHSDVAAYNVCCVSHTTMSTKQFVRHIQQLLCDISRWYSVVVVASADVVKDIGRLEHFLKARRFSLMGIDSPLNSLNNNGFHEPAETQLNDDDALYWPNLWTFMRTKTKFWWSL